MTVEVFPSDRTWRIVYVDRMTAFECVRCNRALIVPRYITGSTPTGEQMMTVHELQCGE